MNKLLAVIKRRISPASAHKVLRRNDCSGTAHANGFHGRAAAALQH